MCQGEVYSGGGAGKGAANKTQKAPNNVPLAGGLFMFKSDAVGSGLGADHIDAPALPVELDDAVGQREKSVIAANADVAAGMVLGAALAHQNAAGPHGG